MGAHDQAAGSGDVSHDQDEVVDDHHHDAESAGDGVDDVEQGHLAVQAGGIGGQGSQGAEDHGAGVHDEADDSHHDGVLTGLEAAADDAGGVDEADLDAAVGQAALQEGHGAGGGVRDTSAGGHNGDQIVPVAGDAHHAHHDEHQDQGSGDLAQAVQDAGAEAGQGDHQDHESGAADHVGQAEQGLDQGAAASHAGAGCHDGGEEHHDVPDEDDDLAEHRVVEVDGAGDVTVTHSSPTFLAVVRG